MARLCGPVSLYVRIHVRINIMFKTKTQAIIREILEILKIRDSETSIKKEAIFIGGY